MHDFLNGGTLARAVECVAFGALDRKPGRIPGAVQPPVMDARPLVVARRELMSGMLMD